jgi:DNA (cytosine-5)-methyltransferase 1
VTFGSLFAGVGGFDLGLERAGLRCVWQVEIDDYCRRVLAKHWPDVPRWDDVRTFPPPAWVACGCCEEFRCTIHGGHAFGCDCPPVEEWDCDPYSSPAPWRANLICGGFPCQDLSLANPNAKGLDGERSGLWSEFARIIRVLRPRYVLVENTPALLARGLGRVLGDLAERGYDAEWAVLPAAAVGADHLRERLFILAHAQRAGLQGDECRVLAAEQPLARHLPRRDCAGGRYPAGAVGRCVPRCGRKRDGLPGDVDRLRGLGNAVYPAVAEWIGRRLMECGRGG